MKIGNIILVICIVLGFTVLCGLGFWQLNRLEQKEAMIARVENNLKGEKLSVGQIENMLRNGEDIEYHPVTLSGEFDHSKEQFYFATFKGKSGYFVYTPFVLKDKRVIFVNRGFVPLDRKEQSARKEGQIAKVHQMNGLARTAPEAKPNSFVPDNDPAQNIYYWKSLPAMFSNAYGSSGPDFLPYFVDADNTPNKGNWPVGGVTRIEFPNSHLQYALTWFGTGGALLAVGGYFLFGRIRKKPISS